MSSSLLSASSGEKTRDSENLLHETEEKQLGVAEVLGRQIPDLLDGFIGRRGLAQGFEKVLRVGLVEALQWPLPGLIQSHHADAGQRRGRQLGPKG
jgi:hypothetical protein